MNRTALIVALFVTTGAPAFAQPLPPAQKAQAAAAKPTKGEDKIVCRFINTTGSRILGERVCKTRAEWSADADRTREDFENSPRQPSGDPSPVGPG